MEIDDKLKNRLAGTAVVTVLAIIFLPMMFDDPVVKKSQVVTELDIPRKPEPSPLLATSIVPSKATDVTESKPDVKAEMTGVDPADATDTGAETGGELIDNSEKADPELDADKIPVDSEAAVEEDINPAPVKKATHKAEPEPEKPVAEAKHAKAKPVKAKETKEVEKPAEDKKLAKAKVEKKPTKPELPALEVKAQDKKTATPAEPAKAGAKRWMVQVVSLNDKTKAEAFRDKLRAQGFAATVDSAWVKDKGRVYRLRVGPELDAQKAQATKTKINQLNKASSFVVSE